MNAVTIAIAIAEQGFPVFPCAKDKRPAIPKRDGGRGFHDASRDPTAIRDMFARRNAVLVDRKSTRLNSSHG